MDWKGKGNTETSFLHLTFPHPLLEPGGFALAPALTRRTVRAFLSVLVNNS